MSATSTVSAEREDDSCWINLFLQNFSYGVFPIFSISVRFTVASGWEISFVSSDIRSYDVSLNGFPSSSIVPVTAFTSLMNFVWNAVVCS